MNPIDSIVDGIGAVDSALNAGKKGRQSVTEAVLDSGVKLSQAQASVNKTEAQHASLFVSGWRPAVGWLCIFGLGYNFLAQPLLTWISLIIGIPAPPGIETTDILTLLFGMLGLGYARSWEKGKGVARDTLYTPKQLAKAERYRAETQKKYG